MTRLARPVEADGPRVLLEVFGREQLVDRDPHPGRIRHVPPALGEGELHGLNLQVHRLGVLRPVPPDGQVAQDPEGDERREALAVGRQLVDAGVEVVGRQRFDPGHLVGRQVLLREGAAFRARGARDARGDLPAIEGAPVGGANLFERAREVGEAHAGAGCGRAPPRQERPLELLEAAVARGRAGPYGGDVRGHEEAVAGVGLRAAKEALERESSEARGERRPATHGSRHRHRVHPRSGIERRSPKRSRDQAIGARPDAFNPWSSRPSQTSAKRSLPRRSGGLDDREGDGGGDGRIGSQSSLLESREPGLRSERVGRGDHFPSEDGRPPRRVGQVGSERDAGRPGIRAGTGGAGLEARRGVHGGPGSPPQWLTWTPC